MGLRGTRGVPSESRENPLLALLTTARTEWRAPPSAVEKLESVRTLFGRQTQFEVLWYCVPAFVSKLDATGFIGS